MTGKQQVLAAEMAKVPPPTITKAGQIAGYSHYQSAHRALQSVEVTALVTQGRAERLDKSRDLIDKGESSLRRWVRTLDKVELDPADPVVVVQCLRVGVDFLKAVHELRAAFPDDETAEDRIRAYRSTLDRGIRIGAYLEARRRRKCIDVESVPL